MPGLTYTPKALKVALVLPLIVFLAAPGEATDEAAGSERCFEGHRLSAVLEWLADRNDVSIEAHGIDLDRPQFGCLQSDPIEAAISRLLGSDSHTVIWAGDGTVSILGLARGPETGQAASEPKDLQSLLDDGIIPSYSEDEMVPSENGEVSAVLGAAVEARPTDSLRREDYEDLTPPDDTDDPASETVSLDPDAPRGGVKLRPEEDELVPPDIEGELGFTVKDQADAAALNRALPVEIQTPLDGDFYPPDEN